MNALSIVEAATADGLVVDLTQSGSLKAIGAQEAVDRWRPLLKQHKADIINLLSKKPGGAIEAARPLPRWCRADCPGLETIPLAKEGDVAGCVHPATGTWRRLDRLTKCPAMEKATRPTPPEWCSTACEHFHQAGSAYCCQEVDGTHWRRDRLDMMTGCPATVSDRHHDVDGVAHGI